MSWDFGMTADLGGENYIDLPYDANYTYNVAKMFYDAFDLVDGIRELNGKTGTECKPLIEKAIKKFVDNKELYEKWNPENGWGDYDGALDLLRMLLQWCNEAPNAVMSVT